MSRLLFVAVLSGLAAFSPTVGKCADLVAVQYHFAGTTPLSNGTNFATANRIFSYPTTLNFENLVVDRLAHVFWSKLQFDSAGNPTQLLAPLLADLLQVESVGSFDATGENFVLAARLNKKQAQTWRQNLDKAANGKNNGFWVVEKDEWTVVGKGNALASVKEDCLAQIQKNGRPQPALNDKWLEAVIDWPQLSAHLPHLIPLKPARATFDVSASRGRFHVTAKLSYPAPIPWSPQRWRIPKELVEEPLTSFTAAQDVEAYMKLSDGFSKLPDDPFTNQFFCWSQREMPFQAYMAWPVADGSKTIKELGANGLNVMNPLLQNLDHSRLNWSPKNSEIGWDISPMMGPFLRADTEKEGDYLLAGLFPILKNKTAAPAALWAQFENSKNVVYYHWELTGPHLRQWRLYSEILPEMLPVSGKPSPYITIVDSWLSGLEFALGNTVTQVTRTGPQELTVARSAPLLFTSVELVWLSHWLADVPAGPVNMNLLPKAKISGPGLESH